MRAGGSSGPDNKLTFYGWISPESAQISGLDMAAVRGRGVKCKMDHVWASSPGLAAGVAGSPLDPSRTLLLVGGPPTAVGLKAGP